MGIIGRIGGKIKRVIGQIAPKNTEGGIIYNLLKPLKKLVPTGEALHPLNIGKIRYNWCGPFNDLGDDRPIKNKVDGVCKNHDYAYNDAFNASSKEEAKRLEREADMNMLKELSEINQFEDLNERLGYYIAKGGISAKVALEDAGSAVADAFHSVVGNSRSLGVV